MSNKSRCGVSYLLDSANDFKLCRSVEIVAFLAQQEAEVSGDVTSGDVHTHDGMWNGESLVYGDSVCHTITSIQDHTCGSACGVSVRQEMCLHERGNMRRDIRKKDIESSELTNWALPAWKWTAQARWRSRRKPLPPVHGFYWGSEVLRSTVQDAERYIKNINVWKI